MPTRKQAYKESYKLTRIQKSDDPVKPVIAKQFLSPFLSPMVGSSIRTTCESFPKAALLLCLLHAKKNIKWRLVEGLRMNEEESKQIFEDLFGSSFQSGLIEIDQLDQFERWAQALINN